MSQAGWGSLDTHLQPVMNCHYSFFQGKFLSGLLLMNELWKKLHSWKKMQPWRWSRTLNTFEKKERKQKKENEIALSCCWFFKTFFNKGTSTFPLFRVADVTWRLTSCISYFAAYLDFFSPLVSGSRVRVLVQSLKCCILGSCLLFGVDGKSLVGFHFYFCQLLCSTPIKGQIILN